MARQALAMKRDRREASILPHPNLGRQATVFDDADVVALLRAAIQHEGSQFAFARNYGVNRSYLNMVLNGKKSPGSSVTKALGLRIVFVAD